MAQPDTMTARTVHIQTVTDGDVLAATTRLLEDSDFAGRLAGSSSVFIKPNLVSDVPEYIAAGSNTDTRVIEALLAYLGDYDVRVMLGESEVGTRLKGRKLSAALAYMGIPQLQKRYDFEIVNLTEADQTDVDVPDALWLRRVRLSRPLLDADLIVNMPKLKTHKYATITCALKNMFGAIPDPLRIRYHAGLDKVLADLNSLFRDRMYVLLDGLVGMEGQGPLYGTPVEMNLLLAAHCPGACDTVAARLMGFEPGQVPHLANYLRHFSHVAADDVVVKGAEVETLRRQFTPSRRNLYVKFESWMCRHPSIVNIIFSDAFRRFVSRPLHPIISRLRGGSYSWYPEDKGDGCRGHD
ncbi:MAG TPA: hypothetical protein DGT21_08785 [Armatimonadetes bacterium]|nr:hypothetical protein [Armatimonadota bacterium]